MSHAPPDDPEMKAGIAAHDGAAVAGITVLLAEDSPGVRTFIAQCLRECGYCVLEAGDGLEALEVAAQHSGPIHLLLTDIDMPRLDGRELHRQLTHQRPEARTLFVSGSAATNLDSDAAFLPKPFARPALLRKIGEVLGSNGRSASQPTATR